MNHPTSVQNNRYGTAQSRLDTCFLITHVCLLILFKSQTNDRVFFASNLCGVTNLTRHWWKLSLYTSLLTSFAEEIQELDSIAGTQGFLIKVSLYIDININK